MNQTSVDNEDEGMVTAKGRKSLIFFVVLILAMGVSALLYADINDPPHSDDSDPDVGCGNCHYEEGSAPWVNQVDPSNDDYTYYNRMCMQCHDGTQSYDGNTLDLIATHSANTTGSSKWSGYWWTVECRTCHNPHYKSQPRFWSSASYLLPGGYKVTAVGAYDAANNRTQVTFNTPLPGDVDYNGYYLVPNTRYKTYFYKIEGSTLNASTAYVRGDFWYKLKDSRILGRYDANIVYGRNFKEVISYMRPDGSTITTNIKMFNATGPFSGGDADNLSTSICYVCHSATNNWKDGMVANTTDHYSQERCTGCHGHDAGFDPSGSCTACHGNPPTVSTLGGPDGLADINSGTGSDNEGKHVRHATSGELNYVCDVCHTGGMPDSPVSDNYMVQIGFDAFGVYQNGTYNGRTALYNGYDYEAGNGGTTINKNGALTCSALYCHSNAQDQADGLSGPSAYATPSWTNTASVQCGDCHKADGVQGDTSLMDSGTHTKHVNGATYDYTCDTCHNGGGPTVPAQHVNNYINVVVNSTYDGGSFAYNGSDATPSDHRAGQGYGTCQSVYCHSDGKATGATYKGPGWGDTLAADCTGCHNNDSSSAAAMSTNAHGAHMDNTGVIGTNFDCSECHSDTVSDSRTISDIAKHVNKSRDVAFDATNPSGGYDGLFACSNLYCHSNGKIGTGVANYVDPPDWNSGTTLDCKGCHGESTSKGWPDYTSGAAGSATANSHQKHAGDGNISCAECHNATTTNDTSIRSGTLSHINGVTSDVVFDPSGNNSGATYTAGTKTCSTTFCHSAGTPQWGGTVACGSCHAVNNTIEGRHSTHYESASNASDRNAGNSSTAGAYLFGCGNCHDGATHGGGPVSGTRTADVGFDATYSGGGSYTEGGSSYTDSVTTYDFTNSTCSATYCHSNARGGDPLVTAFNWNSTIGTLDCAGCHGNAAAEASVVLSGKHAKHIGTDSYGFTCDECHGVTAANDTVDTIGNKANHVDGIKNVVFSTTLKSTSIDSSSGTYSTSCTATYCHSDGQKTSGFNAPDEYPGFASGTTTCTSCHSGADVAASVTLSDKHAKHMATDEYGFTCDECHAGTVADDTTGTIASYAWHVNGIKNVVFSSTAFSHDGVDQSGGDYTGSSTCTATYCHSDGTSTGSPGAPNTDLVWGSGTSTCSSCHGSDGNSPVDLADSHDKHVADDINNFTCDECHAGTAADDSTSSISSKTYHVNGIKNVVFSSTAFSHDGLDQSSGSFASNQCSNIYCHSDVQPDGGASGPSVYNTPTWGGAVNCGDCHDATPATGTHSEHIGDNYSFACSECHSGGGSGVANHVDYRIEIAFQNNVPYDSDTGSYSQSPNTPGDGYGNCSNIYCHSRGGQDNGGVILPLTSPKHSTPQWGTTMGCGIGGCHEYSAMFTGNHNQHKTSVNGNLACSACHVEPNSITGPSSYANHVNGDIDVFIVNSYNRVPDLPGPYIDYGKGNYNGSDASPGVHTAATGYGTCSAFYCHSNGKVGTSAGQYNSIQWGTAATGTCDLCHNNPPDYASGSAGSDTSNSHVKHVTDSSISCDKCHQETTTDGTSARNDLNPNRHVNMVANVTFDSGNPSAVYDTGTRSCSTTYCHGAGTPQWGGAIACGSCHAVNNTIEGAHNQHWEGVGNAADRTAVNDSTAGEYRFRCGTCHDSVTHAGGPENANRTAGVAFDATVAGGGTFAEGGSSTTDTTTTYDYTNSTCTSTYCHSNAQGGSPNNMAFNWQSADGTLDCKSCHSYTAASGTPMSSGDHTAHINDGSDMVNKPCDTCHELTTNNGTTIANKILHVNMANNVTMDANWDSDGDAGNNYSGSATKQCQNVYCHSDGKASATYDTVTWGTDTTSCTFCHGGVDASAGGAGTSLSGGHAAHANTTTYNYGCVDCHNSTASSNSVISDTAWHVNKVANVVVAAGRGGDGNDFTANTCSTTYCHGTVTDTWTTDNKAYDNCTVCHGLKTVGADGSAAASLRAPGASGTGVDTGGSADPTDADVGAHRAHLEATTGITVEIACTECHNVPTSVTEAGHNDTALPAELNFNGSLGTINAAGGPVWAAGAATCSNTYCHDARNMKNAESNAAWANGADYIPTWTNTSYLDGSASDCQMCHGWPPAGTHSTSTDCSGCHSHVDATDTSFTGVANKTLHIDGVVQGAGTCDACHGYPLYQGDGLNAFGNATDGGKGSHWYAAINGAHIDNSVLDPDNDEYGNTGTGYSECAKCHGTTVSNHINGTLNVIIDNGYNFSGNGSPTYTGTPGTQDLKTCSNVSCHYQETPTWSCDGEE